eukprot:gene19164-21799_t
MNAQKDKVTRDLDTNIYKIMDSYRQLLKKGQSYHARAILDQIHDLRMHLLLQTANAEKETSESLV